MEDYKAFKEEIIRALETCQENLNGKDLEAAAQDLEDILELIEGILVIFAKLPEELKNDWNVFLPKLESRVDALIRQMRSIGLEISSANKEASA